MKSAGTGWSERSTLHVFEQEGAWHWGITVPRGCKSAGFKVVAFSVHGFSSEVDARQAGDDVLSSAELDKSSA